MSPRPHQHALVLVFCALLGGAVAHTHLAEDDRYGFCMFRDVVRYQLVYVWVWPDGRREVHRSKDELRGDGRMAKETRGRDAIFGIGGLRSMIGGYVAYMNGQRRDSEARFRAELRWRHYDRGEWREEVFE